MPRSLCCLIEGTFMGAVIRSMRKFRTVVIFSLVHSSSQNFKLLGNWPNYIRLASTPPHLCDLEYTNGLNLDKLHDHRQTKCNGSL